MTIPALRAQLAALDREILDLVARRQDVARAIGELKGRQGQSIRDFAQEKDVVERARSTAAELGISPNLAAQLTRLLIRESLAVQERQRVAAVHEGSGQRALVIGGSGRMGTWFARFLASQGFAVEVADPCAPRADFPHLIDWHDSALDQHLILIAAPLGTTATILGELAERRPPGVVLDIGSLKSPLRKSLRALAAAGVKVTSIHPMFGPDTELLSGCHVIMVDLGVPEANRVAESLFAMTLAEVVPMDLESHDRVVAYILGLSHALNIAFFTTLADSGESAGHLTRLSSTTFGHQLAVAGRVAQENPDLYFEIQHLNDYGMESLTALLYAVERVRSVVRAGDTQAFHELMERGRRYVAGRCTGDWE
jgi:chorismate mutase/prephenate dehydrogenase